jgi:hypothetical protein
MEVTGDLYWHDIRMDRISRGLAAQLLRQEYGGQISSDDILVVTSMEAVPVGAVVRWWNESFNTTIGFAYVRGASNFDQTNVNTDGTPALDGSDSLVRMTKSGGSLFAIETAVLPVLKMFELRSYVK